MTEPPTPAEPPVVEAVDVHKSFDSNEYVSHRRLQTIDSYAIANQTICTPDAPLLGESVVAKRTARL